ncbi:MAG: hypothetical protein ACLFRD_10695 [Nitriliruptoraceae bacterium]
MREEPTDEPPSDGQAPPTADEVDRYNNPVRMPVVAVGMMPLMAVVLPLLGVVGILTEGQWWLGAVFITLGAVAGLLAWRNKRVYARYAPQNQSPSDDDWHPEG